MAHLEEEFFEKKYSDFRSEKEVHAMLFSDRELFIKTAFSKDPVVGCTALFNHYFEPLCNHAIRFVYSKSVAEDIVSDVFERFWKNKAFNSIDTSFRAYLYTAVRNSCLNHIKREVRSDSFLDVSELNFSEEFTTEFVNHAGFDELMQKVQSAIQNLPPKCKEVFMMTRYEGRKYTDVAIELGISIKAVEGHMSKAYKALRKQIKLEDFN